MSLCNRTAHPIHVALKMTDYHKNYLEPGNCVNWGTGKVWFTIQAYYAWLPESGHGTSQDDWLTFYGEDASKLGNTKLYRIRGEAVLTTEEIMGKLIGNEVMVSEDGYYADHKRWDITGGIMMEDIVGTTSTGAKETVKWWRRIEPLSITNGHHYE